MSGPDQAGEVLLSVRDLRTVFDTMDGTVKAVDGASFDIRRGRTLGVVGESGCGKSVTALSILGLIERPGRIVGGTIELGGRDLLAMDEAEIRQVRGDRIAMIFQEPMTSLNPVYSVGRQIAEAVRAHRPASQAEAWEKAVEMLDLVGIPDAGRRAKQFPHQMSGGMRQRVMIAMALSMDPDLLIADEPTTALDVTIQAQIFELITRLRDERQMAMLLITHDLGVIAEMADDVVVMYAGQVVEEGDVTSVMTAPHHPYTRGLLSSIPRVGSRRRRLDVIPGVVPNPLNLPNGCLFARRCAWVMDRCTTEAPQLTGIGDDRRSRCWLAAEGVGPASLPIAETTKEAAGG